MSDAGEKCKLQFHGHHSYFRNDFQMLLTLKEGYNNKAKKFNLKNKKKLSTVLRCTVYSIWIFSRHYFKVEPLSLSLRVFTVKLFGAQIFIYQPCHEKMQQKK